MQVDALIRDLRRIRAGAPPLGFALPDETASNVLLETASNVLEGASDVDAKVAPDDEGAKKIGNLDVKEAGGAEGILGAAEKDGMEGVGGVKGTILGAASYGNVKGSENVDVRRSGNVDLEGAGSVGGAGGVQGGREHAGGRSVVFSQWTSLLDILEVKVD